jgi:hypothetical protein
MSVARDYGYLIQYKGTMFRARCLMDWNGILYQITINDLPVGQYLDDALRFAQAFQFTVCLCCMFIPFFGACRTVLMLCGLEVTRVEECDL